LRRVIDDERN